MGTGRGGFLTIFLAMLLDALCGEPKWLWSRIPHPAVLMGRAVGWLDKRLNSEPGAWGKGIAVATLLVAGALALGLILRALPGTLAEVILLAILLAQRSLSDHVMDVARGLRKGLPQGRAAVAMIVSRDTKDMDDSAVARSAIESAAENLSDGVVAPLFWFLIGGLPGLLVYKITNTADSMIGYLTPRHAQFGWAAAKLDDLLNWLPARITALMILLVTWRMDVFDQVLEEAPRHRSPNAGWPEAALAWALNFALSGPRSYDGQMRDEPFVNANGIRDLNAAHISETSGILWRVWALMLILFGLATLVTLA